MQHTSIKTADIRENFITFFRSKKHKFLNPSKVFNNDPTLFFVNAGMNQLKDVLLGTKDYDEKYAMLTNCQTCIRAGGKHNDLDDVGKDTYHLTSFGMLGNWSLNQYWKYETIHMAFEYLTEICHLDKNKMYATYFQGSHNPEIPEDTESRDIWKFFLPEEHIIKGNYKDNFWTMGDSGPCGACTEIHYDLADGRFRPDLVNTGDESLIEIWNLVFMEYDMKTTILKSDDKISPDTKIITLTKLDKRFVDTGMGLERISMVMQKKTSIYQIDIFQKLFLYAEILGNTKRYTDKYISTHQKCSDDLDVKIDTAYRIFVDHIRTCVIAVFDGVEFDCAKRGFILRKIFRRLLINYYIHLNNNNVEPITNHHIFGALITEVLNFHLFRLHDSKKIRDIFHQEEMLYIGKINQFKNDYNKKIKNDAIKENVIKKYLEKSNEIKGRFGIDIDVIINIDKINIDFKL